MTLVITELSRAGIAMVADSAITKLRGGRIVEIAPRGWQKLLRVDRIKAAVSYWGMIGAVTTRPFDKWLQQKIDSREYCDLESFADYLASELNKACRGKPLANGQEVGIHVAGYSKWADGKSRPVFYHVHNGHCSVKTTIIKDERGHTSVVKELTAEPRKLFEKHQDFPKNSQSVEANLVELKNTYITRNGDYFIYAALWEGIQESLRFINCVRGISIPRDPSDIASRKGFLHVILETMIKFYQCSNQSRVVGGKVTSLGIRENGYVS